VVGEGTDGNDPLVAQRVLELAVSLMHPNQLVVVTHAANALVVGTPQDFLQRYSHVQVRAFRRGLPFRVR
jgi:hypothetical protein